MKHVMFFAANRDLVAIFEAVEKVSRLKYVRTGHFPRDIPLTILGSGTEIANLGAASGRSGIECDTYLVCNADAEVVRRPRPGSDDIIIIDQLLNPESVAITPAGVWEGEIVLGGNIGTVSSSAPAQELMKRFHSALRKVFTKASPYFIGPSALEWLNNGKRLTLAAHAPAECDFQLRDIKGGTSRNGARRSKPNVSHE